MSKSDAFEEKFRGLLREIPEGYKLAQWQFLYRTVIVSMGLEILQKFEADLVGPNPFLPKGDAQQQQQAQQPGVSPGPNPGAGHGVSPIQPDSRSGGQGGGGIPSIIIAGVALGLQEPGEDKKGKQN